MAMDGRLNYSVGGSPKGDRKAVDTLDKGTIPTSAAEVSENIAKNLADTQASVKELQRLSDMVMGHKLQFNVNNDLNRVIVKVVDTSTNEIIREIPSEDLQKLQARMKHTIGLLFDETV
jgi:flagellar protein FlaG